MIMNRFTELSGEIRTRSMTKMIRFLPCLMKDNETQFKSKIDILENRK